MSANDRQVGGSHYPGAYKHWDWVADNHLDYFTARATAYVARWRNKNGVQDLEKALHFIEKRREIINVGRLKYTPALADEDNPFIKSLDPIDRAIVLLIAEGSEDFERRVIVGIEDLIAAAPPKRKLADEVLVWSRFTSEGFTSELSHFRCRACLELFSVPAGETPLGHVCHEND